jgi:hypothetical protein
MRILGGKEVRHQSGGSAQLTMNTPWSREHHGCTLTWDRACSCSSGSSEQDGGPLLSTLDQSDLSKSSCVIHNQAKQSIPC